MDDLNVYRRMFAEESNELFSAMSQGTTELRARPEDAGQAEEIFRAAHSLKAMCSAMGFARSAELSAGVERLMSMVRGGQIGVTPQLLDDLDGALDALKARTGADMSGEPFDDASLPDLDPRRYGAIHGSAGALRGRARLVRVDVTLDDTCTLKAVRAHVVMKRLALMGEVTGSEPTASCLQDERFDRTFAVTLRTSDSLEAVTRAIGNIVEVAEVAAEQLAVCEPLESLPAFSEIQVDALGEMGNIGAGHAATALSELLGKRITLSQPMLQIVPVSEIPYAFGLAKTLVVATYARLAGDLHGGVLSIATCDALSVLVDLANGLPDGTTTSLGPAEEELFIKVGSILQEAYVQAIALMTGVQTTLSRSSLDLDHAGWILQRAARDSAAGTSWAALVRTTLSAEDHRIDIALIFIPDEASLRTLFERLGLA